VKTVIASLLLCACFTAASAQNILNSNRSRTDSNYTGTNDYSDSSGDDDEADNSQQYEEEPKVPARPQNFIRGLRGIDSLSVSRVCLGAMILPGYAQAYNRQYWKIPAIYAAGGAFAYGGIRNHSLFRKTGDVKYLNYSRFCYFGVGLTYFGSIIDGIASYKSPADRDILPIKSTLFSTFLPGLGQAYNGDYWKIPLIYGGFTFWWYWLDLNSMQYTRYRNAYNQETDYANGLADTPSEFNGRLSVQSIKNYRDAFRRNRDYAVLYFALWYAVNVIDATVFAQLSNFDVSSNLAVNVSPALIQPVGMYAQSNVPAVGLNMSIRWK
jgi:hypothetical protein